MATILEAEGRTVAPLHPAKKGSRRRSPTAPRGAVLFFAAPALLLYAFIVLIPGIQGISYAFTNWDGLSTDITFVGFENIVAILEDSAAQNALVNTVVIAIAFTVIQNILGLALAIGLSARIKSAGLLKIVFFAPVVMTPVVVAYLWQFILAEQGPLNSVLRAVGLGGLAQPWLGQTGTALASIVLILVWQFAGYSMVIYLAGLEGVPEELYEAARLDGAGRLRIFWSITLPLLAPAVTVSVMLSLIMSLKMFDQIFVLTGGGPGGSTHTLSTLMYRDAFTYGNLSQGIALGMLLFVLVTFISIIQYRSLRRREKKS